MRGTASVVCWPEFVATVQKVLGLSVLTTTRGIHLFYKIGCVDRLCDLVVSGPDYRSKGLGFYYQYYHILCKVVGLERDPLIFMRLTEEKLGRNSSGSSLENRD
jgi:hypothetical protein